jgi:hypothetical protein
MPTGSSTITDWSSWSAFVDSPSAPLVFRLAAWLVLGWVIGIGLSFLVANLGRGRAFGGGTLGGILAAGVFLLAFEPLGERDGHLAAAAGLAAMMGLMVVRARRRTETASVAAPATAAAPATTAALEQEATPGPEAIPADQSTPAPEPESQPAPAPADPSPQPAAPVAPRATQKRKADAPHIFRIKSSNAEDWMKGQT